MSSVNNAAAISDGNSNKGVIWTIDSATCLSPTDSSGVLSTDANSVESERQKHQALLHQIEEHSIKFIKEATFPFLIAGCGTVCAGLLLDAVQRWELFTYMPEMNVIVTPLLGMKGNLEMTLGSRLSTQTHLGKMDTRKQRFHALFTNIALNQTLAIYLSFLASLIAIGITFVNGKEANMDRALILCATAITTGSLSSLLIDLLMWTVVIVSRHTGLNPDNVTTPFAGSLGDLASLGFLATFGTIYMKAQRDSPWLCIAVIGGFFLISPLHIWRARGDKATLCVLNHGLWPVISAMVISTAAGRIFEIAIKRFHDTAIAAFQPLINGIGGNLVSVQASRLSTALHRTSHMGHLPAGKLTDYLSPIRAFLSKDIDSKIARILLIMVVPCQLIFFFAVFFIKGGNIGNIPVSFVFVYILVAVVQLFILLYVCQWLVRVMWRIKIDPDSSTIPLLTALGDLSGAGLLFAAFIIWFALV
uniref:SLC41A/MgtE integral membrane domain-containing protein n=1 Tax=Plectus sambesii TaxID=2011161 RepID=A0A914WY88_9BILA